MTCARQTSSESRRGCRPRPNQPLKSLVQVYRLFGFHPWGDPAGVSLTAPNDVYRVPESPNGQPVHRATYLSHHSPHPPPEGQRCARPPVNYKHQKLVATPEQRTGAVNKTRGLGAPGAQCVVVTVT